MRRALVFAALVPLVAACVLDFSPRPVSPTATGADASTPTAEPPPSATTAPAPASADAGPAPAPSEHAPDQPPDGG